MFLYLHTIVIPCVVPQNYLCLWVSSPVLKWMFELWIPSEVKPEFQILCILWMRSVSLSEKAMHVIVWAEEKQHAVNCFKCFTVASISLKIKWNKTVVFLLIIRWAQRFHINMIYKSEFKPTGDYIQDLEMWSIGISIPNTVLYCLMDHRNTAAFFSPMVDQKLFFFHLRLSFFLM